MNVESLKSELQQVLDSDVVLRKEFNELKRSLSDYRNQLIMRDEDCKRLQVTIDVLNTKLVVMERDNTNYKGELTSFKELRGSIKEQLDAKQTEIDKRLQEIQELKNDLNTIATDYELKIEHIRNEASSELERVKQAYSSEIHELKTNTQYKESGIREEFENRLSQLSIALVDQEQSLSLNHEEEIMSLKSGFATEISQLKDDYENKLRGLTASEREESDALKLTHTSLISSMQEEFNGKLESLESSYQNEISELKTELSTQKEQLISEFNSQLDTLKQERALVESSLISGYEAQLEELKSLSSSASENMSVSFQSHINELKSSYEEIINQKNLNYVSQISNLADKYEARLSNTLIHSTSQNSKLNEELSKVQLENDHFKGKIRELVIHIDSQNSDIENLSLQLSNFQLQLKNEELRFSELSSGYEAFKQQSLLSSGDQMNELNSQIEGLNEELRNLGLLLESTTNSLSETELSLELKGDELNNASQQIEELNAQLLTQHQTFSEKEQELNNFRLELEASVQQQLENKEIEYQKLLVENATIINEIDLAQDKVEAYEAELALLKAELEELTIQSAGKVEHFKETLANKNFEVTNLEANNAALCQEMLQVKMEVTRLESELSNTHPSDEAVSVLQHNVDLLNKEKSELFSEISSLREVIAGLNDHVGQLNSKLSGYELELETLKNSGSHQDQDDFIDRLFKQIDALNDQRLALLDEKDQMASQLIKMNDVVGSLSQHIDSESIDVTSLNNHRKNVILAKNSGETGERSHMKEQINDLVREIDKCIALLST